MKITETARLLIREIELEDLPSLLKILADPEVMKYSFRGVCTKVDIEHYIKDCSHNYKNHEFGQWAVIEKKSSKLIGVCGPNPCFDGDNSIIHLASRFAVNYWGKGFASEALIASMEYVKTSLHLNMMYALIEPVNERSIKLVLKYGFKFQKETVYKGRALFHYIKLL